MSAELKILKRKQKLFSSKDEFSFNQKIGIGRTSVVYKANHTNTKAIYAIKVLDLSKLPSNTPDVIEKELIANSKLKHPNITKLFDVFQDNKKVYMVMEYVGGGTLSSFLDNRDSVEEEEIRRLFKQILSAVAYIQAKGFVHRDLKPENVLLDKSGNVKICDFGETFYNKGKGRKRGKEGTVLYMAPESLRGDLQDYKADIWSLGVLLYEMYHKRTPFYEVTLSKQLKAIFTEKIKFRRNCRKSLKDLIGKMLVIDKEKRMDLKGVINSKYMVESFRIKTRDKTVGKKKQTKKSLFERKLANCENLSVFATEENNPLDIVKISKDFNTAVPLNKKNTKKIYSKRANLVKGKRDNTMKKKRSQQNIIDFIEDNSYDSFLSKETTYENNSFVSKKMIDNFQNTKGSFISERVLRKLGSSPIKRKRGSSRIDIKKQREDRSKSHRGISTKAKKRNSSVLRTVTPNIKKKKLRRPTKNSKRESKNFCTFNEKERTKLEFDFLVEQYKKELKLL